MSGTKYDKTFNAVLKRPSINGDKPYLAKWKAAAHEITAWINAQEAKQEHLFVVPLTSDLWFKSHRRLSDGRFPKSKDPKENRDPPRSNEWKRGNDLIIIESLLEHFAGDIAAKQLFLCTEDVAAFCINPANPKTTPTKRAPLDSRLQNSLQRRKFALIWRP